ncbi:MAG TPA: response regulator [Methanospirillum sp.]|nr:response regulator [Methanospirillum sp.]
MTSQSMNVLIVDDQYVNRYLLEKILTGYGFVVFSAEDGQSALEIARSTPLDLIISDILLPKMDGFQFCREIKNDNTLKNIPFVFYTAAYTEKKDQDFAESLGADRYILKPTDPVAFISIIREILSDMPRSETSLKTADITDEQYLSEHNRRIFHQLEKKVIELKDLNKALQISEDRYRNLFEQANDLIILHEIGPHGVPGRILEVNGVACKILGYSREELLKMEVSAIDSPVMKDRYDEIITKLVALNHLTFEGELLSRSGQVIPVEISAHIYPDSDENLSLSIYRDITQRKKAENDLNHALMIINKNLLKMAVLNDRIRNPLAVILSSCELCNGTMKTHVDNAVQSIDDLISQIDSGWIESEKVRNYLYKYYRMQGQEYPPLQDPTLSDE